MLHSYLGACEHVGGGVSLLEEGSRHRLPVLILPVVLLPGSTLPLHVSLPAEIAVLQRALSAPPPMERLLVVVYWPAIRRSPHVKQLVGCTAEIKQFGMGAALDADGNQAVNDSSGNGNAWTAVARGRQRVLVDLEEFDEQGRAPALVLSEGCTQRLPKPWVNGYAAILPTLCKPWDLTALCSLATRLCKEVLPEAERASSLPGSTPLQLSYALAANLPMQGSSRQALLECESAADRLRKLLVLLRKLGQLHCGLCGLKVADVSQTLAMTAEGVAAAFVNQHGYVHDLVTLAQLVDNNADVVRYQGQPETQFSWFPGYAWTICNCRTCGWHLGWRFTATKPDLQPHEFWGLRRDALSSRAHDTAAADQPQQHDEDEWRSAHSGDEEEGSDWESEHDSEVERMVVVLAGEVEAEQDDGSDSEREDGDQDVGQRDADEEGAVDGRPGMEDDGGHVSGEVHEQEVAAGHRPGARSQEAAVASQAHQDGDRESVVQSESERG